MHSIKDIVELSKENPIIFSYYSLYKKEKLTLDDALIGMIKMLNRVINENIRRIDLITVEYMKDANGEIIIFLKKGDLSSSISLG